MILPGRRLTEQRAKALRHPVVAQPDLLGRQIQGGGDLWNRQTFDPTLMQHAVAEEAGNALSHAHLIPATVTVPFS